MLRRMSKENKIEESDYDSKILALMRKLYPNASEQQLIEGKRNLEEYVETAWKIADRLQRKAHDRAFDGQPKNSYDDPTKVESTITTTH